MEDRAIENSPLRRRVAISLKLQQRRTVQYAVTWLTPKTRTSLYMLQAKFGSSTSKGVNVNKG